MNSFNKALDFAVLFFILSGSLYFLYYLLQFNKPIYLLISVLIYVISFSFRRLLFKTEHKIGFSEVGMFFASLIFLAYTLYIFKLDPEIIKYLPDKLLINSGGAFTFLFLMNLFSKEKSRKYSILTFLVLIVVVIFRSKLDAILQTYPWISSLIIGTPYIYLLLLLVGIQKIKTTNSSH